jgi:hypothetical protein
MKNNNKLEHMNIKKGDGEGAVGGKEDDEAFMNGNSFYLEPPLMCNVNGLAERPLKFDTV